jgi:hypothetical protein
VTENYAVMWTVFQPLLFGLIGNEIDFNLLDLRVVGLGIGCLAVSLSVSTVLIVYCIVIVGIMLIVECPLSIQGKNLILLFYSYIFWTYTLWRSWLRHCATSRKVAGSIPDGLTGIYV